MTKTTNKVQCSHCCGYFNPRSLKGAAHLASCRMYNGYANYETWAVALWLDNDEGSYRYWREQATECKQEASTCRQVCDGIWTPGRAAVFLLADRLKNELTDSDMVPMLAEVSMYSDLLGAALSDVAWDDIAETMLAE